MMSWHQITWLQYYQTIVGSFGEKKASLKQLADALIDNIQLKTIQKVYESALRRLTAVIKANGGNTPS